MRKYRQLLLLIVSIVSLSLFLVYRHEYNRLHYVLEVFNFFGQPCNFTDLVQSNNIINHHDWGPIPIWDEDEGLYVYSSIYLPSKEVQTIIVRKETANHAKSCYLWYENRNDPVIGKLKYINLGKDVDNLLNYHHYFCGGSTDALPYAISFTRNNKKRMKMHPVAVLRNEHIFNTTLCVLPSNLVNKSTLVEFLSFHSVIGVDSFIIYANNLPHKFKKLVQNLSTRLFTNITFIDWNFPLYSSPIIKQIVSDDCMLRAISQSKYVLSLDVNEYVVPSSHYKLYEVLGSLDSLSDRLNVPVQTFCIKSTKSDKPIALQNKEAVRDNKNEIKIIYKNRGEEEVISAQGVDKGVLSIHKYAKCDDIFNTIIDNSMLKFYTDFIRSTLYQLYLYKQL